ncbi:hypothetical protein BDZ90DRAFT_229960 [Jaminaea rosea]|uniref:Uncharacterized protein n=1 Tax=Jaminaea rosea TaxID=1569628 RepID=A0A316V095_9BASI|nr:hypothetical protein BDZ90DRAFT_229960 [Jaminaea rosea]PWN30969.1 hypothetical protein BDZ90DRAFT_229960 [Jaminaea rosea]
MLLLDQMLTLQHPSLLGYCSQPQPAGGGGGHFHGGGYPQQPYMPQGGGYPPRA